MKGSFSRLDSKDAVGEFTDMWVRMQDFFFFFFFLWMDNWMGRKGRGCDYKITKIMWLTGKLFSVVVFSAGKLPPAGLCDERSDSGDSPPRHENLCSQVRWCCPHAALRLCFFFFLWGLVNPFASGLRNVGVKMVSLIVLILCSVYPEVTISCVIDRTLKSGY